MLSLLHIENIAVIESADITFDRGFNVLTGETGAGKSIVIDAISAILGERAYRDVIRTGTDKACVSAVFSGVPHLPWFEENRVEYDPQELLVQQWRRLQMASVHLLFLTKMIQAGRLQTHILFRL